MEAILVDEPVETAELDAEREARSLSARELGCVVLSVVIADLTLFRGHGYAGVAAMGIAATLLLWVGKRKAAGVRRYRWVMTGLLIAAAAKLVWEGSSVLGLFGALLLCGLVVALEARPPSLVAMLSVALRAVPEGLLTAASFRRQDPDAAVAAPRWNWLAVLLPLAMVGIFGVLFVLANPDLADVAARYVDRGWRELSLALRTFSFGELIFWLFVGLLTLGMLQPVASLGWILPSEQEPTADQSAEAGPSVMHVAAYRNSLLAVIVLFAAYLIFEFRTLWFRDFPEGFYYAGYAHQGAAWLTVALALTTVMLSAMFRGPTAHHERLARLRPLAWVWSLENLVLAAAVYNRMWIYVQFNGMTRMRTIGLLGITAVVVGLLLMLRRLARGHSFPWLVQRYVWVVGLAVLTYLLLPVDMLVHSYNTRRILAGDLAPVVQIVAHPVDSGGALVLPSLLDSKDPIIRDGIAAMLADRQLAIREQVRRQRGQGWTAYQVADNWLAQHLAELEPRWSPLLRNSAERQRLIERFREYAMQWY